MSAAMTFYTMLSLAPVLMIAVAIAGYLYEGDQVQQEIIDQLAQVADHQTVTTVEGLLRNATQPKAGLVAGTISLLISLLGAPSTTFGTYLARTAVDGGSWYRSV